jgi:DNA-binding NtrC family response regulator
LENRSSYEVGGAIVDNEEYTVLIVDDEEMVTTSLSTLFMLETEYNVLTLNSPSEAVEELETEEVDLVISDYLMPGDMNGVEFLMEVKRLQPDAIRILLTAYADKENAIKAINEVGLYQYVEKPWDNDALLLLVRNGLMHGRLWKQLTAKTQELSIARENLERVQTEILKAFV